MARYCDYITVDKDFVPIFSEEQDIEHPRKWEQFVPHRSLRNVFAVLVKALERASTADKRPIWVSGAYGTGKTYAAFLVKHLLEDNPELVGGYFSKFRHSPFTSGYDERIMALREKGSYLVVFRSGSSGIRTSRMLLTELQRSITAELQERNLHWNTPTITERISSLVEDANSVFNWQNAFDKHWDRFDDRFDDASQVINLILQGPPLDLLEDVAEVLEEEGFSTLSTTDEVKDWIEEVISVNNLSGIVFIWDELTNFFTGEAPVDTLQELAHACGKMPFYLYVITHRTPQQLDLPDETAKVLHDRFHHVQFEMESQTAYELIQSTLKVIPATSQIWDNHKQHLWGKVKGKTQAIRTHDPELKDDGARNLLPIHPYSAFLLTNISRYMSSSQRTLFQFLQTDEPGSFIDFCRSHPSDWSCGCFLTADSLWDYFFREKGTDLPDVAQQAIGYYGNIEQELHNENERRVAKATLLLYVINHYVSGVKLLRPTRENLYLAFYGTPVCEQVESIMDALCSRKVFYRVGVANSEEYTITLVDIDEKDLDRYIVDLGRTCTLRHLSDKNQPLGEELDELFGVPALHRRQMLTIVSAEDLNRNGERVFHRDSELAPYQIKTVIVVASDAVERRLCQEKISNLRKDERFSRYIFILLGVPFTEDNLAQFVEQQARASYAAEKGFASQKKHYEELSRRPIAAWISAVKSHSHTLYFRDKSREVSVEYLPKFLDEVIEQIYPYRPESFYWTATAYRVASGKRGAEIGLGLTSDARGEYAGIVEALKDEGIWSNPEGFLNSNPSHPIGMMKNTMDELFENGGTMTLPEFWSLLQSPPFGLFESPMTMVLMGLLMRQFVSGYYKSDGHVSAELGPSDLVEMIESSVKGRQNASKFEICRMSPLDERLCSTIQDLLGCRPEEAKYPKEAQKELRLQIHDLGYPIWSLCHSPVVVNQDSDCKQLGVFVRTLDEFSRFSGEFGEPDYQELAKRLVEHEMFAGHVSSLLTRRDFADGFECFIRSRDPGMAAQIDELGLDMNDVRLIFASLKNEEPWLWEEQHIEERLKDAESRVRLIHALSLLNESVRPSLEASLDLTDELFLRRNLPEVLLIGSGTSEVEKTTQALITLIRRGSGRTVDLVPQDCSELASAISSQVEPLRRHLTDSIGAIRRFTKRYLDEEISESEAHKVYVELHDMPHNAPTDVVRAAIASQVESLARQKMMTELRKTWAMLTKSDSPEQWSDRNGVPIQWVLGDSECLRVLDVINSPDDRSSSAIEDALSVLSECRQDLTVLTNAAHIEQCLYAETIELYFDLPGAMIDADDLSIYLRERVASDVYSWPSRPAEIRGVVEEWMKREYERDLDLVRQQICSLDERALRELLDKLVGDARIGLRVLAMLSARASESA